MAAQRQFSSGSIDPDQYLDTALRPEARILDVIRNYPSPEHPTGPSERNLSARSDTIIFTLLIYEILHVIFRPYLSHGSFQGMAGNFPPPESTT
ncbi:hypothetical protein EMIT047CA2_50100 [Pseudomonas soli]